MNLLVQNDKYLDIYIILNISDSCIKHVYDIVGSPFDPLKYLF